MYGDMPNSFFMDSNYYYITDYYRGRIFKMNITSLAITTIAGRVAPSSYGYPFYNGDRNDFALESEFFIVVESFLTMMDQSFLSIM